MSDAQKTATASAIATTLVSTIHLGARGCSGRAVRYRVLAPDMITHIESQCSHSIDQKATSYDFGDKVMTMALSQMIVAVSEPVTKERYAGRPEKAGDAPPKPVEFKAVDPTSLDASWNAYFTAKDSSVLKNLYRLEHAVQPDEMDEILAGKVTTVAG